MVVCLNLVGRLLFSSSDGSEGERFRPVPGPLIMHRMLTQTARTGDTESVHAPTTGRVKREGVQRHSEGLQPTSAPAPLPQAGLVSRRRRPGTPGCGDERPAVCLSWVRHG